MHSKTFVLNCALILSLLLPLRPLHAATNPPSTLSDYEIDQRLNTTSRLLQSQKSNADYWEYGWGGFNGVTMVWSAVQASHDGNYKNRSTDTVQAIESLIGLADVIFRPLPAYNASNVCDGITDRLQCLAAKEALLERSAQRADEAYEFGPHLGNLAFNLAAGAIVWGLADMKHALTTFIPGAVIGEIQLWTTPQQPLSDLGQYTMQFSPMLRPNSSRSPTAGLVFTFSF